MLKQFNDYHQRDVDTLMHNFTDLQRHQTEGPFIVSQGDGVYVIGDDGKRYLEGMSGLWCASLGFSEKRLADAAYRQLLELPYYHLSNHRSHPRAIELAQRLIDMAPVPMSKVTFACSGSEANDAAVKMVWYYNNGRGMPQKRKIISRQRSYHGVTIASGSVTGLTWAHASFNLPIPDVRYTSCPHYEAYKRDGEDEQAFSARMADDLEQLILAEGPETVAAFFAEPVMGGAGVVVPPAGYVEKIQAVLDKYDVLLVADEIICGFGRTGTMFGSQTLGMRPDIMTVAKGISAGYMPLSAVMISPRVYEVIEAESGKNRSFGHGFTYSAHPVAAAVALEALNIYDELNIVEHVREMSELMFAGLRSFADHPLVGEVRGIGLMAGVELLADRQSRTPYPAAAAIGMKVRLEMERRGVIVRNNGDTMIFSPPLIIKPAEVKTLVQTFGQALDVVHAEYLNQLR